MAAKKNKPQKKPSRASKGRPRKPPYGELPFSMKLTMAKTGMDLLHPAVVPAIFRAANFGKPIPKDALADPTFADLNKISDLSLHQQFGEYAAWISDLGSDPAPDHPEDLVIFLIYAHTINHHGRFPAMQEIVRVRKKREPQNKNADLERGLETNLPKMRLPYIADEDFNRFKACVTDQPEVIDDDTAFWRLATEAAPIYTPIERWPLDLVCHLLVGADLGGLDNDEKPVLVPWVLTDYLDDLKQAGFKEASDKLTALGTDWRNLPSEQRSLIREKLEQAGRLLAVQSLPWFDEAEKLSKFVYADGGVALPCTVISEQAANWHASHAGLPIFKHLELPGITAVIESLEARNIRLLKKWARSLLTKQGKGGKQNTPIFLQFDEWKFLRSGAGVTTKHTQEASQAPKISPDIFRVSEAAAKLNVSERTIRRLVKDGELRALPQLRHLLIPRSEIERLLDVRR